MKNSILILLLILTFSCSDYRVSEIKSPDGNYSVIAKVNRTDKESEFYAEPIFEIYDSEMNLIAKIESNTGDFNKWKIGWSKKDNILIMNSSDIGIKAWKVSKNGIEKAKLTDELNNQAKKLIAE